MLDLIQSLWMGGPLSEMEKLSIRSFVKNGHPYHLYTYGDVESVPDGAIIVDANEILPSSMAFTLRGGYSSFSDFFFVGSSSWIAVAGGRIQILFV